ncbi:MAG TPA: signal recognition particle-docking protein FtsY [Acidimicrobiales bacterium]|nr:signal recognition particle-docking protein FtsY [Acidimicrobiales bacterium]
MLLVIIVVACVAFVALAGMGGYTVIARRREHRALPAPPPRPPQPSVPPAQQPSALHPAGQHPAGQHPASQHPAGQHPVAEHPSVASAPRAKPDLALDKATVAEQAPQVLERPRFRDRLGKARSLLADQLAGVRRRGKIDKQAWDELEEALVLADVGILTTEELLKGLKEGTRRDGLATPEQLVDALREELVNRLQGERELHRAAVGTTTVWLFVGVNGVGKTTTIGKVAMREESEGRRVVLAAGDTFRAAAADQLELWAERAGAGFVRGNEGGDPGAVVFDAVQHANARHISLVLADTAGRLHNKVNLMEELKKVRRVADRPPASVTEVLLVLDATTGQNGLVQARQFTEAVAVTGIVLTKLDGTAKGGIAVAITSELGIPIKLVGLGEGPEDLVPFDAREFVEALLPAD